MEEDYDKVTLTGETMALMNSVIRKQGPQVSEMYSQLSFTKRPIYVDCVELRIQTPSWEKSYK